MTIICLIRYLMFIVLINSLILFIIIKHKKIKYWIKIFYSTIKKYFFMVFGFLAIAVILGIMEPLFYPFIFSLLLLSYVLVNLIYNLKKLKEKFLSGNLLSLKSFTFKTLQSTMCIITWAFIISLQSLYLNTFKILLLQIIIMGIIYFSIFLFLFFYCDEFKIYILSTITHIIEDKYIFIFIFILSIANILVLRYTLIQVLPEELQDILYVGLLREILGGERVFGVRSVAFAQEGSSDESSSEYLNSGWSEEEFKRKLLQFDGPCGPDIVYNNPNDHLNNLDFTNPKCLKTPVRWAYPYNFLKAKMQELNKELTLTMSLWQTLDINHKLISFPKELENSQICMNEQHYIATRNFFDIFKYIGFNILTEDMNAGQKNTLHFKSPIQAPNTTQVEKSLVTIFKICEEETSPEFLDKGETIRFITNGTIKAIPIGQGELHVFEPLPWLVIWKSETEQFIMYDAKKYYHGNHKLYWKTGDGQYILLSYETPKYIENTRVHDKYKEYLEDKYMVAKARSSISKDKRHLIRESYDYGKWEDLPK